MTLLQFWIGAWLPGFVCGFALATGLGYRRDRKALEARIAKRPLPPKESAE